MNVEELLRRLSYGELSGLSIGNEGSGLIDEQARPKVIAYINEGLTRLHSRFLLREKALYIQQEEGVSNYHMLSKHAHSRAGQPGASEDLYIIDVDDPFQDDLIKILQVTNSAGITIPLNDAENSKSYFTPQPNLLQIPAPKGGELLAIGYQARHQYIDYDDGAPMLIELPYVLEEALTSYVAYKVFHHMNGPENSAKALEHQANYDRVCVEVADQDLVSQSTATTSAKFYERGFV